MHSCFHGYRVLVWASGGAESVQVQDRMGEKIEWFGFWVVMLKGESEGKVIAPDVTDKLKGIFKFPSRFLWFLVEPKATALTSPLLSRLCSLSKSTFLTWACSSFKSLFSLFKWELPSSSTPSGAFRPKLLNEVKSVGQSQSVAGKARL